MRWRLTRNRLRKGGVALFVLVLIGCVILAVGGFSTFANGRSLGPEGRKALLAVGFGLLVVGWTFIPLTGGGADETVDPTRLALLPLSRRQLLAVLGGAACSGPATIAVLLALCGVPIGVPASGPAAWVVTILTVPVVFLLGLGVARLGAALLVRTQRSRRGRDIAVLVSGFAGVSIWLASQSIGPLLTQDDGTTTNSIVRAFSWSPPGWAARAVLAAARRQGARRRRLAARRRARRCGCARRLGDRHRPAATNPRTRRGPRLDRRQAPLGGATSATGAALAKELRYLLRSPSRRVQTMLGLLMGIGFSLIQVVGQTDDIGELLDTDDAVTDVVIESIGGDATVNLFAADPLLEIGGVTFGDVVFVIVKMLIIFVIGLVGTMFMVWFERKVIAGMQNRVGPNKAGPWGLLQTLADGIKLFFKEDLMPDRADRFVFKLAPYLAFVPAFLVWTVIPLGGDFRDGKRRRGRDPRSQDARTAGRPADRHPVRPRHEFHRGVRHHARRVVVGFEVPAARFGPGIGPDGQLRSRIGALRGHGAAARRHPLDQRHRRGAGHHRPVAHRRHRAWCRS